MPSAAQSKKLIRRRKTQRGEKNYSTTDINAAFKKWSEKRGLPVLDAAMAKARVGRIAYGKKTAPKAKAK